MRLLSFVRNDKRIFRMRLPRYARYDKDKGSPRRFTSRDDKGRISFIKGEKGPIPIFIFRATIIK